MYYIYFTGWKMSNILKPHTYYYISNNIMKTLESKMIICLITRMNFRYQ